MFLVPLPLSVGVADVGYVAQWLRC